MGGSGTVIVPSFFYFFIYIYSVLDQTKQSLGESCMLSFCSYFYIYIPFCQYLSLSICICTLRLYALVVNVFFFLNLALVEIACIIIQDPTGNAFLCHFKNQFGCVGVTLFVSSRVIRGE